MCQQLLDGALQYAKWVYLELDTEEVPTVTEVKLVGRRKQDAKNPQR